MSKGTASGSWTSWRELAQRKILLPCRRPGVLALGPDGRIAFGCTSVVSVIDPSTVGPSITQELWDSDGEDESEKGMALALDRDIARTRSVFPATVGHEIVYAAQGILDDKAVARAPSVAQISSILDIGAVAWMPLGHGPALLVAPGEGGVLAASPPTVTNGSEPDLWGAFQPPQWHASRFGARPPCVADDKAEAEIVDERVDEQVDARRSLSASLDAQDLDRTGCQPGILQGSPSGGNAGVGKRVEHAAHRELEVRPNPIATANEQLGAERNGDAVPGSGSVAGIEDAVRVDVEKHAKTGHGQEHNAEAGAEPLVGEAISNEDAQGADLGHRTASKAGGCAATQGNAPAATLETGAHDKVATNTLAKIPERALTAGASASSGTVDQRSPQGREALTDTPDTSNRTQTREASQSGIHGTEAESSCAPDTGSLTKRPARNEVEISDSSAPTQVGAAVEQDRKGQRTRARKSGRSVASSSIEQRPEETNRTSQKPQHTTGGRRARRKRKKRPEPPALCVLPIDSPRTEGDAYPSDVAVLIGNKHGLGVWAYEKRGCSPTWIRDVTYEWTQSLAFLPVHCLSAPRSRTANMCVGHIACGTDERVAVFRIDDTAEEPTSFARSLSFSLVWLSDVQLAGTVMDVQWRPHLYTQCSSMEVYGRAELGVACGNSLSIISWSDEAWATMSNATIERDFNDSTGCTVFTPNESHARIVCQVAYVGAEELASCSMDGSVRVWRADRSAVQAVDFGLPASGQLVCRTLIRGMNTQKPVLGMCTSPFGLVVVLLLRMPGIVEEELHDDVAMRRKFAPSARQTRLVLVGPHMQKGYEDEVSVVLGLVNALIDSALRECGDTQAANFWELDVWIRRLDSTARGHALRQLQTRACAIVEPAEVSARQRRVCCGLLRVVGSFPADASALGITELVLTALVSQVRRLLVEHCLTCIDALLSHAAQQPGGLRSALGSMNDTEVCILEAMATTVVHEATGYERAVEPTQRCTELLERLREVDTLRTPFTCPMCRSFGEAKLAASPDRMEPVLLQAEGGAASDYVCERGHRFARCSLTMLPCVSFVPDRCAVCAALSLTPADRPAPVVSPALGILARRLDRRQCRVCLGPFQAGGLEPSL